MGLDLKILPLEHDEPGFAFAHSMLEFGRYYRVFDELKAFPTTPITERFHSFASRVPDGSMKGESCYGPVITTPYGERIEAVTVAQFLAAVERAENHWRKPISGPGAAVVAYLKACESDMRLALYWH